MCVCMYACMYVCMHACMYACMHVCVYVRMYYVLVAGDTCKMFCNCALKKHESSESNASQW